MPVAEYVMWYLSIVAPPSDTGGCHDSEASVDVTDETETDCGAVGVVANVLTQMESLWAETPIVLIAATLSV